MSAVIALDPIIRQSAKRTARGNPDIVDDLVQEAYVAALQCEKRYTGDKGASLATYAHNAIKLAQWRHAAESACPVTVAKNKTKTAWSFKRAPNQAKYPSGENSGASMDRRYHPAAGSAIEQLTTDHGSAEVRPCDARDKARIYARLHEIISEQPHAEHVAAVLLGDESISKASNRAGISDTTLRRCTERAMRAMKRDRSLLEMLGID